MKGWWNVYIFFSNRRTKWFSSSKMRHIFCFSFEQLCSPSFCTWKIERINIACHLFFSSSSSVSLSFCIFHFKHTFSICNWVFIQLNVVLSSTLWIRQFRVSFSWNWTREREKKCEKSFLAVEFRFPLRANSCVGLFSSLLSPYKTLERDIKIKIVDWMSEWRFPFVTSCPVSVFFKIKLEQRQSYLKRWKSY